MIPITSDQQAEEIASKATFSEIREIIVYAESIEEQYRRAFQQRQETTDSEQKRIFGQVASDYATQFQLANEALKQYQERIRRILADAFEAVQLLPETAVTISLSFRIHDEIERMK